MKLCTIYEDLRSTGAKRLYKALNQKNYEKFLNHNIPGFMAEYDLAMIYAQPSLTGADKIYLISAEIPLSNVPDLTSKVKDMCYNWAEKFPELRSEVWTAYGSGHGGKEAIYYGKPIDNFELEAVFNNEEEWQQAR